MLKSAAMTLTSARVASGLTLRWNPVVAVENVWGIGDTGGLEVPAEKKLGILLPGRSDPTAGSSASHSSTSKVRSSTSGTASCNGPVEIDS